MYGSPYTNPDLCYAGGYILNGLAEDPVTHLYSFSTVSVSFRSSPKARDACILLLALRWLGLSLVLAPPLGLPTVRGGVLGLCLCLLLCVRWSCGVLLLVVLYPLELRMESGWQGRRWTERR